MMARQHVWSKYVAKWYISPFNLTQAIDNLYDKISIVCTLFVLNLFAINISQKESWMIFVISLRGLGFICVTFCGLMCPGLF